MRTDIKVFLILLFGLFIIAKFKSTAVSFLYMIMVVIGTGLITNDYNANESFEFLRLLMWPFAFAILFFWRHRFDEKERVDSFEVFFGTLFLVMILSLAISLSYGMAIISFIVFVPALYMFSKVTYSNSVWYLERPIESLLTIVTIILSILFSYEDSFRIIEEIRYGLSNIGFMKICTLIVFLIAGIYAYFTYREYEEQNKGTINWFILAFPLVIIVANLLGKDSYGHYLMIAYSLALGVYYFFKGLQSKNELKVILGFISASIVVHLTVYKFIGKYMHHDIVIGTYLLSWSLVFLTAVVIMRRIWKVSNEEVKVIE